jgi:hypothetical protein
MWSGGEVQRWIDENIEPLWNARAAVEQASEGDALTDAATALVALIEGPGCLRWEDGRGFRIKDTDEWVRFYVAAKNATHQKNAQ